MKQIDPPNPLIKEMLAKVGRNLLIFQQIEAGLKVLLPFAHPSGSAAGMDQYRALRDELKKSTFGGMRSKLVESIASSNPEQFDAYVASVIESRNEFVHHFWKIHGASLLAEEGLRSAIDYLDKQFSLVESLHDLVEGFNKDLHAHLLDLTKSVPPPTLNS